jgi:Zn-dependent peptidase ImmA (M78 family)
VPEPRCRLVAYALRQQLGLGNGWVDPFAVLRDRGAVVVRHAVTDDGDIDGSYRLVDEQAFVFVNSKRPAVRQRFTAAHELAHHELDAPAQRLDIVDLDIYGVTGVHQDMNHFAGAFLIDSRGVRKMREEGLTGDALVGAAIAEFAVSFQAAVIELKYLHLITKAEHDDLMTRRDAEDFRVGDFVGQFGLTQRPDTGPPEELDPSYLAMVKSRYEHGGLNVTAVATALRIDEPAAQEWLEGQGVKAPEPIEDHGFYFPE